jgi:hypothetical protein
LPTGWYVGAVVCALLTLFLVWIVVAAASTHPTALVALVLTPLGIYATAVLAKWLVER